MTQEKEGCQPPDKPKEGGRSEIAITEEWRHTALQDRTNFKGVIPWKPATEAGRIWELEKGKDQTKD